MHAASHGELVLRRRRHGGTLLAVLAFVVGYVLVAGVVVVQGRLVDADPYLAALDRTDAYERTYTQVLADPEFARLTEELGGALGVSPARTRQARSLVTSTLRATLPPSRLRAATEDVIEQILAYVRGERERLDAEVEVNQFLDRIDDVAIAAVSALLADAAVRVVTSLEEYRDAIRVFLEQVAQGTVPGEVPVLGGTSFDADEVIAAVMALLGDRVDPRLREQIAAAVLVDDQRDALITAASALVQEHAERVTERLRQAAVIDRRLDVVAALVDHSGRTERQVIAAVNDVRDAARWFRPATAVAGAALMGAAVAGLLALNRADRRRTLLLLAASSLAAGAAVAAAWVLVTAVTDPPLAPATTLGPGSWGLPRGLRRLLADVEAELAAGLAETVRRLALVPTAAGGALALFSAAPLLRRISTTPAAVAAGLVALVAVGTVWAVPERTPAVQAAPRRCNGHPELCGRRYDEVVHAATHNAMASPGVVFVWPEQDHDIATQLASGVRALLVDTHYWTPLLSEADLRAADPFLTPALAEQLYQVLGPLREARPGTYLCHNHCALGAIPLLDALRDVGAFLDENPDEVVTLIVQDAITRADTAGAFDQAGLGPYLHVQERGRPWPTLGELIDRGTRLVVFSESQGPPPVWYHRAFQHIEDTPYLFLEPQAFTCAPNRGRPGAPLFLMNHWVQRLAPDRADAATVNRADVIVSRARECAQLRGQLPTFIAVNFSNIGDVVGAVATLNGVG